MLKTEWLHDSNQCDVQYTSPLEKCKTEHYQLKLDSIWGQAVETNPVMIPIKYEIRDSAYIACIDSDEIVDTMTISDYSRKIARLLNGEERHTAGIHKRGSIKFHDILQKNHHTLPEVVYNANTRDDNLTSLFVQLKLPANTYIFANNIYPLYALGFSEEQIIFIEDIERITPPIPPELIHIQNRFAFSSVKSIYYAPGQHKTAVNRMPVNTVFGNLKWLSTDTFESVYYPAKREERYIDINQPILAPVRNTRSVSIPVISKAEKNMEIKTDEENSNKRRKFLKLKDWDSFATATKISARGQFDKRKLKPKPGESVADGKYDYWRTALVTHIIRTPLAPVFIPLDYLQFDERYEIITPLTQLMEDTKEYVKLAASAALTDFYNKLENAIISAISTTQNVPIKQALQRNKDVINQEKKAHELKQSTLIGDVSSRRDQLRDQIYNENSSNDNEGNDEVSSLGNTSIPQNGETPNIEDPKSMVQNSISPEEAASHSSLPPVAADQLTENDVRQLGDNVRHRKQLVSSRKEQLNKDKNRFLQNLEQSEGVIEESKNIWNEFMDVIRLTNNEETRSKATELTTLVGNKKKILESNQNVIGVFLSNEKITTLLPIAIGSVGKVHQQIQMYISMQTPPQLDALLLATKAKVEEDLGDIENDNAQINDMFTQIREISETIQEDYNYLNDMEKAMKEVNDDLAEGLNNYTTYVKIPEKTEEIDDDLQIEKKQIDDLLDELQEMSYHLSDEKDTASGNIAQANMLTNGIKNNLFKATVVYNDFLDAAKAEDFHSLASFVNKADEKLQKANTKLEKIVQFLTDIKNELNDGKAASAKTQVDNLKNISQRGELSFAIEQQIYSDLPKAEEYLTNIDSFTSTLHDINSTIENVKKNTADNYIRQISDIAVDMNSLYTRLNRGYVVQLPEALPTEITVKDFENVAEKPNVEGVNEGVVVSQVREDPGAQNRGGLPGNENRSVNDRGDGDGDGDSPGPQNGGESPSVNDGGDEVGNEGVNSPGPQNGGGSQSPSINNGGGGGNDNSPGPQNGENSQSPPINNGDGDEDMDIEEFDERTDPRFKTTKKYSIGFVHFENDPFLQTNYMTVTKDTEATEIVDMFKEHLNEPLLQTRSLNMAFKPTFTVNAEEEDYSIETQLLREENNSHLKINLYKSRFSNLLRLQSACDSYYSITIPANITKTFLSDNFTKVNPFINDFNNTLPLILTPVNAGLFNTFATNIGETSCLGLIEDSGRVKNPIPIIMRPADKERFTIKFYSTNLQEKFARHDTILYFHFIVDPL